MDDTSSFDRDVGRTLANLRRRAEMSQTELAAAMADLGAPMAQRVLTKIENGLRPLRFSEAVYAAAALGVPVATLARTATIPIEHTGGTVADSVIAADVGPVDIDVLRERIERLEAAYLAAQRQPSLLDTA